MMEKKDEATSLALRVVIDSCEDILGTGGKISVLNFAGLEEFIDSPPDYSDTDMVPQENVDKIIRASLEVIGESWTKEIIVRAGRSTMRHIVDKSKSAKMLSESQDMTPRDKMKALLNLYAQQINRPPDFEFTTDGAVFHNPACTLCNGVKTKKPFCNYISGVFEGMGIFIAGFDNIRCEETVCKASGGDECRYEITYGD
jgi:hypothetical protein